MTFKVYRSVLNKRKSFQKRLPGEIIGCLDLTLVRVASVDVPRRAACKPIKYAENSMRVGSERGGGGVGWGGGSD